MKNVKLERMVNKRKRRGNYKKNIQKRGRKSSSKRLQQRKGGLIQGSYGGSIKRGSWPKPVKKEDLPSCDDLLKDPFKSGRFVQSGGPELQARRRRKADWLQSCSSRNRRRHLPINTRRDGIREKKKSPMGGEARPIVRRGNTLN